MPLLTIAWRAETDAFMKEAQIVQTRLENLQGSVTKEDITFGDEVIASEG